VADQWLLFAALKTENTLMTVTKSFYLKIRATKISHINLIHYCQKLIMTENFNVLNIFK